MILTQAAEVFQGDSDENTRLPKSHCLEARKKSVCARAITDHDLPELACLLHEGFPSKSSTRFFEALVQLSESRSLDGRPQLGYLLASEGKIVGALLTLVSRIVDHSVSYLRCNVSCWYVRPAFRLYAPLLVLRSQRNTNLTHLNVWPAPHTWETIKAQGFDAVCSGTFVGVPVASFRGGRAQISPVRPGVPIDGVLPAHEARVLHDHAKFGCLSFLTDFGGEMTPFVFRRRWFRRAKIPAAQLIYCRSLDDLGRLSGPVGRYLASRGMPWLVAGANGLVRGVPGTFLRGKMPIYFKGRHRPREGDLTYTEAAMFGF